MNRILSIKTKRKWIAKYKKAVGVLKSYLPKDKEAQYRTDLNMWEQHRVFFIFFKYWYYKIWHEGKLLELHRLRKTEPDKAKYLSPIKPTILKMGNKELQEKYNGNKWLVPINRVFDSNLK